MFPNETDTPLPLPALTEDELLDAIARHTPVHTDGRRVTRHNLDLDMPFFVHYVGGKPASEADLWRLRCDASFFKVPGFGKVAGVAWQVHSATRDYKQKWSVRRRFVGASAMAEVMGACLAMQEALEHKARHAILMTDNQNVVKYLADIWRTSPDSYARPHRDRLESLALQFDSMQLMWVRTKPALTDLDNLARRKSKAERARILDSWEGYLAMLDAKMKQSVQRFVVRGVTLYDGFPASVNPPRCSCQCWVRATAPALAHNPRNYPRRLCKHLAAAFADAGASGLQMAEFLRDYHLAVRDGHERPVFARRPAALAKQTVEVPPSGEHRPA